MNASYAQQESDSDDDYNEGGKSRSKRKDSYESESDPELSDAEEEKKTKSKKKDIPQAGPADFRAVLVPRAKLAEFSKAPWFEEWVKGKWNCRLSNRKLSPRLILYHVNRGMGSSRCRHRPSKQANVVSFMSSRR